MKPKCDMGVKNSNLVYLYNFFHFGELIYPMFYYGHGWSYGLTYKNLALHWGRFIFFWTCPPVSSSLFHNDNNLVSHGDSLRNNNSHSKRQISFYCIHFFSRPEWKHSISPGTSNWRTPSSHEDWICSAWRGKKCDQTFTGGQNSG